MRLLAAVLSLSAAFAPGAAQADSLFQATIGVIDAAQQAKMDGVSWTTDCPVGPDELASIRMSFHGFDGKVHEGALVVHQRVAGEIVAIFSELFSAGFQIELMRPYEDFAVAEYAASNATVGFYCRPAQDDASEWSWHAYGLAVDLNPGTNPFHDPKEGWWPKGSDGSRDRAAPGLISAGSAAVAIFMRHGWAWGGIEGNPDYMHFAKVTVGDGSNPLDRPVWADTLREAPK